MARNEEFKFAPNLSSLCLKVVIRMADEYGIKASYRRTIQKAPKWPLTNLNKEDLATVYSQLSLAIPLRNVLAFKPDNSYWRRRVLQEFLSPHSHPRAIVASSDAKDAKEKKEKKTEARKGRGDESPAPPPVEEQTIQLPPVNFLHGDRDWFCEYLELSLANKIESNSQEGVEEILNFGVSQIRSLSIAIKLSSGWKVPLSEKTADIDVFEIISKLISLQRISIQFRSANLLETGLSVENAIRLAEALPYGPLVALCIYESGLDDECVDAILSNICRPSCLQEIDFRHNRLTSASIPSITKFIKEFSIKRVRIDHNSIDVEGAALLSNFLASTHCLKSLCLDLNPLGDEGSVKVLEGLARSRTMEMLTLAGSRITGQDTLWKAVVDAVNNAKALRFLSLASNLFEEIPPKYFFDTVNKTSSVKIFISSAINPFHIEIPAVKDTSWLISDYKTLDTTLKTFAGDRPKLVLPSLSPEILHGLKIQKDTFEMEQEILGCCIHSKTWRK